MQTLSSRRMGLVTLAEGGRSANLRYQTRIKNLLGSVLLALYPLDETSGATAHDTSGNGLDLNYRTVNLNAAVSPNNKPCPLFDDYILPSPVVAAVFDGDEGAVGGFVKMPAWGDAAWHHLFHFYSDANNNLYITRNDTNGLFLAHIGGGTVVLDTYSPLNTTGFLHCMISWSLTNNRMILWINGMPVKRITGQGAWTGALSDAFSTIGGYGNTFDGNMADLVLLNREPTPAEAKALATASVRPKSVAIIGDSISVASLTSWPILLQNMGYNGGWIGLSNHAQNAHTIMVHMDGQVAACANDNADLILIALGINDDNAGDMGALQTKVESNIAALKVSNPLATIIYLSPLPAWTDVGGGTEFVKGNIRTAIAAACTAQGVACWDRYTDPWITAADTSDGLHPTAAGQIKVATEILARL
jgi:lysophospholipase L1-like esterase